MAVFALCNILYCITFLLMLVRDTSFLLSDTNKLETAKIEKQPVARMHQPGRQEADGLSGLTG